MTRPLSLIAALLLGTFAISLAAAQAFPPHRFFGSLTVGGQPAAAGTVLRAYIGDTECATFTLTTAGQYVIDVPGVTLNPNCGRSGQSTVSFRVGDQTAGQTATYRDGGFEQLNLTIGPAPAGYNAAQINLDAPCVPAPGQRQCDAERTALWEADRDAWARRGVTDTPPFIPFEGNVFNETVVFRVEARDPAAIRNIARILGNPFLQITFIRFVGANDYVEITNLGGGPQDMSGWSLRSPDTNQRVDLPSGLVLQGGQACRIYSGAQGMNSCGVSFNNPNTWPDAGGRIVLYYDALDLPGDDKLYSADPNNQPPPPNLQGLNVQ
jgi:hypothetical protein